MHILGVSDICLISLFPESCSGFGISLINSGVTDRLARLRLLLQNFQDVASWTSFLNNKATARCITYAIDRSCRWSHIRLSGDCDSQCVFPRIVKEQATFYIQTHFMM